MKKRILLLNLCIHQLLSKKILKRYFFQGLFRFTRETKKLFLWTCVALSFSLALQANAFSDVHPQDWFAKDVEKFQAMGVINGEGLTGNFAPGREANRAEIAKMFSRYDDVMQATFRSQLKKITLEILAEVSRDIEVKTYSFKNKLERRIDLESGNQLTALSLLNEKAKTLELSLAGIDKQSALIPVVAAIPIVASGLTTPSQVALEVILPTTTAISEMLLIKKGIPARCPAAWTQSNYTAKWLNGMLYYERTCVTAEVCPVKYYQGGSDDIASCDSGYKQSDYLHLGKDVLGTNLFRRVCYTCN